MTNNFIMNDSKAFPELLEASYDQSNYYICEIKREKEHGGIARIFQINVGSGDLTRTAYLNYPLNLPPNEKIIEELFKKINKGSISEELTGLLKRKRLHDVYNLLNCVEGRR